MGLLLEALDRAGRQAGALACLDGEPGCLGSVPQRRHHHRLQHQEDLGSCLQGLLRRNWMLLWMVLSCPQIVNATYISTDSLTIECTFLQEWVEAQTRGP